MTNWLQSIRPAHEWMVNYGVKSLVHGAAGSGKTPIFKTAPNPLLLSIEPGLMSMRGSTVPTIRVEDANNLDDFFRWFFESNESKKFDTLGVDSASELPERYLIRAKTKTSHGLQQYGIMATDTYKQLNQLFYMPQKHIYLICKQGYVEIANAGIGSTGTVQKAIPYFPGNMLNVAIPHLYDVIMHLGIKNVPGVGQVTAFQTKGANDVLARDRSGQLAEFEYPDLTAIFKKAMS